MEYRTTVPEDGEYAEDGEREELHAYVQSLMTDTGSNEMVDSLLITANMCETRALSRLLDPGAVAWYRFVGKHLRMLLEAVTADSDYGLPKAELEDPFLYYPPTPTSPMN